MLSVLSMKIKITHQINAGMKLASLLGIQDKKDSHKIKGEVAGLLLKVLGILDLEATHSIGEEQLKWRSTNLFFSQKQTPTLAA